MELAIILIIGFAILGVIIYFSMRAHNKMVSEGQIISRRTNFMENAEEFTLVLADPDQVTQAVNALDYHAIHTEMKASSQQQIFQFKGSSWTAQLRRLKEDRNQTLYRFEFTNWKTHNGMAQDALNMNRLTTAIEKAFLALDPDTQVRSVPLEFKTRHSIL